MSELRSILVSTVAGLARGLEPGAAPALGAVREAGFHTLLVPEARGGFGGDWRDAYAVMRAAGYHALAAPLGEDVVAGFLCASAGLDYPEGGVAIGQSAEGGCSDGRFTGVLSRAPWARAARWAMTTLGGEAVLLEVATAEIQRGRNISGEPRDNLRFIGAEAIAAPCAHEVRDLGAMLRVAQSAGALTRAVEMAVDYVNTRVQFGRALAKFQSVQHAMACLASEVAAVECAGQAAAAALDRSDARFEIAAAKLRANMAIAAATAILHQAHGAIGFTQEHALHHYTRRLLSWRSEFGGEHYWAGEVGRLAAQWGGAGLWRELTRRTDSAPAH